MTVRVDRLILALWAILMLAALGFMIAELVAGYPQALAMIFLMIIVSWMTGQILEGRR